MAQFPSLVPSEASVAPGAWPATHHQSLNGAESSVRHGSAAIGGMWRPRFVNITEANYLAILNHYRGQRSQFDSFNFDSATLAADRTPAGFAWLYASKPQIVDQHVDVFTVQCEFRCEPRGLVVAPGRAWRTGATTFTPGARSGGVVYAAGANWVTSETTFTPGTRSDGVGSNAGVQWVTSETTFTPGARSGEADPDFSSVVVLCGFNGSNGSTTFIDEGPLGLTLTAKGGAQISTAQSVYGGSSLSIAGSGSVGLPTNSALVISGDFTLDARCRFNNTIKTMILGSRSGTNFQLAREDSTALGMFNGTTGVSRTASFTTNTNTWYALRWARSGSTVYFFAEGTLLGTGTMSGTFDFSGGDIGALSSFSGVLNGFIDEFRLSTVCRSTASYAVDTQPFPRI